MLVCEGCGGKDGGLLGQIAYTHVVHRSRAREFSWGIAEDRRRFSPKANPPRLRFTLISKDGGLETAFELDHNAPGSLPK